MAILTIIMAILPLIVQLIQWLSKRKAAGGKPIPPRVERKLRHLLMRVEQLRWHAEGFGISGDPEEPIPVAKLPKLIVHHGKAKKRG